MSKRCLCLLSVAALLGVSSLDAAAEPPAEHPITVDGHLHVEEWQEGADQAVDDGGWVRMQRRDDGLYLAVRTNQVAMVDVFVHRGDELHQLHASGQVGGALFKRGEDELWHLEHSYPWIGKEAKPKQTQDDMRARLRTKLRPMPPPAPHATTETAEAPTAEAPEAPPMPKLPPKPPAPPVRDSAEDAATVARHLEEHGWTATLLNMGGPTTTEVFLSNDFLRAGDRLLVTWPVRTENGFEAALFPADAAGPPEGHSAAFGTEPFALSSEAWYVVE